MDPTSPKEIPAPVLSPLTPVSHGATFLPPNLAAEDGLAAYSLDDLLAMGEFGGKTEKVTSAVLSVRLQSCM
jgi:hypothetical protein